MTAEEYVVAELKSTKADLIVATSTIESLRKTVQELENNINTIIDTLGIAESKVKEGDGVIRADHGVYEKYDSEEYAALKEILKGRVF